MQNEQAMQSQTINHVKYVYHKPVLAYLIKNKRDLHRVTAFVKMKQNWRWSLQFIAW